MTESNEIEWSEITIRVRRIGNGFIVHHSASLEYQTAHGDELFFPTLDIVTDALQPTFLAAQMLDIKKDAQPDF